MCGSQTALDELDLTSEEHLECLEKVIPNKEEREAYIELREKLEKAKHRAQEQKRE